jgi:uncharacterized protein YndB with AHSA1/START domain
MTDVAIAPGTPMTDTQQIVVDEVFPHPPEVVWKTLTTAELMGQWLMTPTGFAPTKGNRFTYQTTPAGAWDGVIRCEVLEAIPGERLVHTWIAGDDSNTGYGSRLDTVVTWSLAKVEGGTRVRLAHAGFTPKNDHAYRKMSEGWQQVVRKVGELSAH